MTPQDELERIVDRTSISNVLTILAVICGERADNLARHDAHAAKDWAKCADAIDSAIVKVWGSPKP